MSRFRTVAVGGTFDRIHRGHWALLTKAFEVGDTVLIGVTSDKFAEKLGKTPDKSFDGRVQLLKRFLGEAFHGRKYVVQALNDFYGPLFFTAEVEAIVVSDETLSRVELANHLREMKGLEPVEAVIVQRVLAEDGKPISTTRIRRGEIDDEGRVIVGKSRAGNAAA